MEIPTEVSNIETKLVADATHVVVEVDHYETDLISFVSAHKGLAVQFAIVVCSPVAFAAYELGKHFAK